MRAAAMFLIAIALSIVPRTGSAQVSVTAPAAGAESSYRTTVVSWEPIPGASSYHLEIDDDPSFGSPEVDVTISGTSYALSGERLKLHGQRTWAAYVRINGTRWNAWTFSPSYFTIGEVPAFTGRHPALGIDSQNRVYLANAPDTGTTDSLGIWLRTSSDWSNIRQLSLGDHASGLDLVVDQNDVAHASWIERRSTGLRVPYYTNSSTGWNLVPIPIDGACLSQGSMVAGGGRIDLFYLCSVIEPDQVVSYVVRWTTTNGMEFTRMSIPNNDTASSISAARDGAGNLYVASERYTEPYNVQWLYSSLQTSADGWISHAFAPGQSPALAVTSTGEWHVLRWSSHPDNLPEPKILYSNSLRGFQTWTVLPTTTSAGFFNGDVLVVDESRHQLHAAVPGLDGIQLCTASYTGLAVDTGTSWTCAPVGDGEAESPELALAPDGTLHLAWNGTRSRLDQVAHGLAYANSLGSFLATNVTPDVRLGAPSSTAGTVMLPAAISDPDGDDLAGHIHVGRFQDVRSLVEPQTSEPILNGQASVWNSSNDLLIDGGVTQRLQFNAAGAAAWNWYLQRSALPSLPATIEVRTGSTGPMEGTFIIEAWDDSGVTIVRGDFVPYVKLTYSGTLPGSIDISALPEGNAYIGIGASDKVTSGFAAQGFTKAAGQNQLVLTEGPP